MGIDTNISVTKPDVPSKGVQSALLRNPVDASKRVPYTAGDNTVINLGASSSAPYPVRLPRGNYTLYTNPSGDTLGFEKQITPEAKMVVLSPEEAEKKGADYFRVEVKSDFSAKRVPRKFLEITRNGKVSTFLETESVNLFIDLETDEILVYDKKKNKLIPNEEAKQQYEEKTEEAIRLIEQNSAGFYNATGGKTNLSEEIKKFDRKNILVEHSDSDDDSAWYIHDTQQMKLNRANYASLGGKFYLMPNREDMNSKIGLYYNSYPAMSASPLDIATLLIHELGHAKDNDGDSSVQEEADVETVALNFADYVKDPSKFVYKDYNYDPQFKKFLEVYRKKGYPMTSPKHGQ